MARQGKGGRPSDADRYKKAASDALILLDWCIEYFADSRHERIAGQLARSRRRIAKLLRD
jgi:hypothetical protein